MRLRPFQIICLALILIVGIPGFIETVAAADPSPAAASPAPAEKSDGSLFGAMKDDKPQGPLLVKSDTLRLNGQARNFTYQGNVEIRRSDLFITSDTVVGTYNEKRVIQVVTCEDNVVITRGDNLRASSNKAVYHVQEDIIEMTEGPELFHNGNNLTADKVTLFLKEDRSKAEGNVRVKVQETPGVQAGLKAKTRPVPTSPAPE